MNNGDAIVAPSSVDYSHADAQSWFGVKNSLDIFTAASDAWVAGIQELNGDMNHDGTRDTGLVSHFDGAHVVGAENVDYNSIQDATVNVSLTRSTFANDGTETFVTVDLGTSYDRDSLEAASVALGSTTSSERIGIVSGETIFGTARHINDTTGYAADILSSLNTASLVTAATTSSPATIVVTAGYAPLSGTYELNAAGNTWVKANGTTLSTTTGVNTAGVSVNSSFTVESFDAATSATVTTLNSGALDMIKNSEIKEYAESFLLNTVDLTSPAWLQAL